jgi:hypothetical protein
MDNSLGSDSSNFRGYELLECLEKLVNCERQLTAAVSRVLPLLTSEETDYKVATPQVRTISYYNIFIGCANDDVKSNRYCLILDIL